MTTVGLRADSHPEPDPPVAVLPPRTGFLGAHVPRAVLRYDGTRSGLSTVVPDGAHRGTQGWSSKEIFLKGLDNAMKAHPEMRRNATVKHASKDTIAHDKFMAAIEMLADAAAHRTGRDVQVSKRTIAKALGCAPKTVQRISRMATRVVQCLVMIVEGRELTELERIGPDGVWRQVPLRGHRLKQHGVPPVRAFHIPAWLQPFMYAAAIQPPPVDNQGASRTPSDLRSRDAAPLPRRGLVSKTTHLAYNSPSKPKSSKGGSLRSPSGPGSARTASIKKARERAVLQLAAEVRQRLPWAAPESLKRLSGPLWKFLDSPLVWNGEDLENAIQTDRDRQGLGAVWAAGGILTPFAFLADLVRPLNVHTDHPRLPFVDATELRCGRTECDHGWIVDPDSHVRELLGLLPSPSRRCDQCRPGAWPEPESTVEDLLDGEVVDDVEPPF